MNRYFIAAVAVSILVLNACGSSKDASKANFKTAVQAYLNTKPGACIPLPSKDMPFQIEKSGGFFRDSLTKADVLVEAGLLVRHDAEVPNLPGSTRMVPGFEYNLTDDGKKQLVKAAGGNIANWDGFCAGKYKVVEIVNFTDPADAFGTKISQVNYKYKVEDPAAWAKSPKVLAAFAQLAKDMKDDASDKAILVSTNEGWMHEGLSKAKGG